MAASDCEVVELGDFPLANREVLRGPRLAYATYGRLNAARDNGIVFPKYYAGTHRSNACIIALQGDVQGGGDRRARIRRELHDTPHCTTCTAAAGIMPARPPRR